MKIEEAEKLKTEGDVIIWKDSFSTPDENYDILPKAWLDYDEFEGSDWEVVR